MSLSPPTGRAVCPQCQEPLAQDPASCPRCALPLLTLAGKYRLLRVLGHGGSGTVYLARHLKLEAEAERVIKVLKPEVLSSPPVAERFRREIQLTALLSQKDPHVV